MRTYKMTGDGQISGETNEQLVHAMNNSSMFGYCDDIKDFMKETAGRCKLQSSSEIRSDNADNYSVYQVTGETVDLYNLTNAIGFQNATSPYALTFSTNGTYSFAVVAFNNTGYRISNVVTVIISLPDVHESEPVTLILGLLPAFLLVAYKKKKT